MPREPFDPVPWITPYVDEEEVLQIKMAFDLFDLDHGGSIDPKGTSPSPRTQRSHRLPRHRGQGSCSLPNDCRAGLRRQWTNRVRLVLRDDDPQTQRAGVTRRDTEDLRDVRHPQQRQQFCEAGSIGLKELRKVSKELGELADDFFLQEMIERADADGDCVVNEQEFYNLMTKKAG